MAQAIHIARSQVGVSDVLGLNLRAADNFVKLASTFQSDIRVCCEDLIANGRSILDLLTLAAECGTMLILEARGCDAEDAVTALATLIRGRSETERPEAGLRNSHSGDSGTPG